VLSTTEQMRVLYDSSNYYSTTVGSSGAVTFNAVGASSSFHFSDSVNADDINCNNLFYQNSAKRLKRYVSNDSDYGLNNNDYLVSLENLSASRTITLPDAAQVPGQEFLILDESGMAATYNINLATSGGSIFGGSSSISTDYGSATLFSNGTNYFYI